MQNHQPAPYPQIRVEEKHPAYIKEILSNLGGEDSEMSAVSLYVYNHLVTAEHPEMSAIFRQISMEEMRHLSIFGQIALQLGADPRLWQQKGRKHIYWSPSYHRYTRKPRQIISNALYSEYLAVDKYTKQAKMIQDASIVENLQRIIIDEQQHIAALKTLLQQWA